MKGKERAFLVFSCFIEGFASAEATKGLSDRPLETFGPFAASRNLYIKRFPCGRQEKGLPILPRIAKGFASAEATRGLSGRPLDPFGGLYSLQVGETCHKQQSLCGRQGKCLSCFFLHVQNRP